MIISLPHDAPDKADHILDQIEEAFSQSLRESRSEASFRRNCSPSGCASIARYFFKPYRIIYRVLDTSIYVLVIADGRRDMADVTAKAAAAGLTPLHFQNKGTTPSENAKGATSKRKRPLRFSMSGFSRSSSPVPLPGEALSFGYSPR